MSSSNLFAMMGRGSFISFRSATLLLFLLLLILPSVLSLSLSGQSRHGSSKLQSKPPIPPSKVDSAFVACTRRSVLVSALLVATTTSSAPAAMSLDIDSFMSQELSEPKSAPSTQKLSDDEALCRFGQPSPERGAACERAGLPTKLKKGGVDAYGNVDRFGKQQFQRCRIVYVEDPNSTNNFLVKKTICE